MKWKVVIGLLGVAVSSLLGLVYYYNLDPALLTTLSFYEDLANPSIRIIRVEEGLRKEQIAEVMAGKLGWDKKQKDEFINGHLALNTTNLEGRYFPKTYMLMKDEDPTGVTVAMLHEFSTQTAKIKRPPTKEIVNQDTAIKIASIIQREAGDKSDMKLISGIIWNRIFNGMKLQVDATLQYAKGTEADGWWRQIGPKDKSLNSPYNTYTNKGLPPSAIANPGLAAIDAAYNPETTSCLYYLHDKNRNIHCAKTYEEHRTNIQRYY